MALTVDSVGFGRTGIGGGMSSGALVSELPKVSAKKTVKKAAGTVRGGSRMSDRAQDVKAAKPASKAVVKKSKKAAAVKAPRNGNDDSRVPRGLGSLGR